jgi:hypothetical protein
MPRDSRPPGFDMTYRPKRRRTFGPPTRAWILPLVYAATSVAFLAVVMLGQMAPSGSWLFHYIVEGDAHRVLGARALALIMVGGGVAALIRTGMRGVIIHPDGLEARYVASLGWPRVRNCTWPEIDRLVLDAGGVCLHLWNGSLMVLPPVRDERALAHALERIAAARAIPVRGGSGQAEPEEDD